uniref:Nuclear pore complex protein NUP98A n=1 Tax=Noccaea caerulescens TaxID=107243 RepID=A0A1J3GHE8_NOCCA
MIIDFSEPECSTCFHNRTSGVLNPRFPEPPSISNVIASSVTSTPVSSEPAQALGHDSAAAVAVAVASTSTSSPPQAQAFGHDSAADVASTSTSSPVQSSSPHGFSFGPDVTSVSSAPTQAHGFTTSGSTQAPDSSAAPTPSIFGSTQAPSGLFGPKPSTSPAFGSGGASSTFTSSPPFSFSPAIYNRTHPVNSASTQPFGSNTPPSPWSAQYPVSGSNGFAAPTPYAFGRSMEAPAFGSGSASATSTSSTSSPAPGFSFSLTHPVVTSGCSASTQPFGPKLFNSRPAQDLGKTASASPSLFTNGVDYTSHTGHAGPHTSPSRWSMQAPVQASEPSPSRYFSFGPAQDLGKTAPDSPPLFRNGVDYFARPDVATSPSVNTSSTTVVFGTTPVSISSPVGPTQDFPKTGCFFAPNTTPKNPFSSLFPGFGDDYLPGTPSNSFRVPPPSTTPVSGGGPVCTGVKPSSSQPSGFNAFSSNHNTGSPVFATHQWDVREQGTGNPRYAPTPCTEGPYTDPSGGKANLISISASFSYQDKSHEELRWEDYKKGDKGGSFPSDPITRFQGAQRPHETNAVSSPASGCTACGATSSSSASGYSGSNVATSPPSAVTSLPGLFCPMMYGTTNLAAQGTTTTPAFQAYPTMFGANLAAQSTTTTPVFQAYPTIFGANLAAQSGIAALFQAYPTMYGTNLAAQGIRTTPALQVYPTMFGTNLAAQGTTPAPLQAYPTMYGTNAAAQGTTTTPGLQAYPMMYGTNIAVQVTTPPGQAYPVHGLILLPFAAMNLQ